MTTLTRKLRRAYHKRNAIDWPGRETPHRIGKRGYAALHPTKGWRFISNRRLAAQRRMAEMLDR